MSFRKEEKLHIHESQLLNLLNWLYKNDGYKLYDTRTVSSTYFDNDNMQMFKDSEEGCVPRKKIRRPLKKNQICLGGTGLCWGLAWPGMRSWKAWLGMQGC